MKIVNGFTCRTSCDVVLAKKGVDPAHPHAAPGGSKVKAPEASSQSASPRLGENVPVDSGTMGTVLSTML